MKYHLLFLFNSIRLTVRINFVILLKNKRTLTKEMNLLCRQNMEQILAGLCGKDPMELLIEEGVYYEYPGGGKAPHAISTTGKHLKDFYILSQAFKKFRIRKFFANRIVDFVDMQEVGKIDAILSSSYSSLYLGQAVADEMGKDFLFTEKEQKNQVWSGKISLEKDSNIMLVEDVVTTSFTVNSVVDTLRWELNSSGSKLIKDGENKILVFAAVHRPPEFFAEYEKFHIVPVIDKPSPVWDLSKVKCPLCEEGSIAMEPKIGGNWSEFSRYIKRIPA